MISTLARQKLIRMLSENYLNSDEHTYFRLMPYWMMGMENLLDEIERRNFCGYSYAIMKVIERTHFKQDQFGATKHIDDVIIYRWERVIQLYDLYKEFPWAVWNEETQRWHKKYLPQRLIREYERGFANYEAVLQFKRLGLALPSVDSKGNPMTIKKLAGCVEVKTFIDLCIKNRDYPTMDYYDFYILRHKEVPGYVKYARWLARIQQLQMAIPASGGLNHYYVVGFTHQNADFEVIEEINRT